MFNTPFQACPTNLICPALLGEPGSSDNKAGEPNEKFGRPCKEKTVVGHICMGNFGLGNFKADSSEPGTQHVAEMVIE